MGWIRHHGMVVTGIADQDWSKDRPYNITLAHAKATDLGLLVSNIVNGTTNGYASIFIAPDGSKEGWDTSDQFNGRREQFIDWLKQGTGFDWFEYAMDTDNDSLTITASNVTIE
jgi:hypothetical protein